MKFDCGLTPLEKQELKKKSLQKWHRWFAWKLIRLGSHDCRWLETIERKGTYETPPFEYSGYNWQYRAIETPKYLGAK